MGWRSTHISISSSSISRLSSVITFLNHAFPKSEVEILWKILWSMKLPSLEKIFSFSNTSKWDLGSSQHNFGASMKGDSSMTRNPSCIVALKEYNIFPTFLMLEKLIDGPKTTSWVIKFLVSLQIKRSFDLKYCS